MIASTPRTGSWLLADALNETGLAGRPEDYFRAGLREYWARQWGIPIRSGHARFLECAVQAGTTANGVFAVKLQWNELDRLVRALHALPSAGNRTDAQLVESVFPALRYVHLSRRDTSRQAVSLYRAMHSGRWFVVGDSPEPTKSPPPDPPDLRQIRWLEEILIEDDARLNRYFERAAISPLRIYYEDLAARYDRVVRRVLEFIGSDLPKDFEVPRPRLVKQADDQSEQLLVDYRGARHSLPPVLPGTTPARANGSGVVDRPTYRGTDPVRLLDLLAAAQRIAQGWLVDPTRRAWFEQQFGFDGGPREIVEGWAGAMARTALGAGMRQLDAHEGAADTQARARHLEQAAALIESYSEDAWLDAAHQWLQEGALDIHPTSER